MSERVAFWEKTENEAQLALEVARVALERASLAESGQLQIDFEPSE